MIKPKILLFVSLFLTFAFSIIGWSVVINALVKSNNESSYIKSVFAPDGAVVDIDYHDVYSVCAVIAAASALLTALSLLSTASQTFSVGTKRPHLRLQACLMLFGALWLLAAVIACDVFFATRSTKVTATVGEFAISQTTILQIEAAIGVSPEYKDKWYLRLCAILPWFAVLFATLSGALLYSAARNTNNYAMTEETESEKMVQRSEAKQV